MGKMSSVRQILNVINKDYNFRPRARRDVKHAHRLVRGSGIDGVTAAVGRAEVQVQDGARVRGVDDVEVVTLPVHVPKD